MSVLETIKPADLGRLANNGMAVRALQDALGKMETSLNVIPRLFLRVVRTDAWLHWIDAEHGEIKHIPSELRRFLEADKPHGCRTPIHIIERILRGTEAWEPYLEALRGERGGLQHESRDDTGRFAHNRHNVTVVDQPDVIPIQPRDYTREAPTGNSVSYAVRRLKNNRPDLFEQVKTGELTAHGAMVAAGFKLRSITVDDDPERAARRLLRHFQGERLQALIAALSEGLGV